MFLLYFLASGFVAASFRVEWRTGSFKVVGGCGVFQRVGMLRRTVGGGVRPFRGRTGILDLELVLFWRRLALLRLFALFFFQAFGFRGLGLALN